MKDCTTIWKRQTPYLTNRNSVEGSVEAPKSNYWLTKWWWWTAREREKIPEYGMDRLQEGLRHDTTLLRSWLIECLEIYGAKESTIRFLKNTMPNWKTILTSSGTRLEEVNIRRGIIQGDSLSQLLFTVAMIPITRVLERMEVGFQLKKGGNRIKHLMFMDASREAKYQGLKEYICQMEITSKT